MAAVNMHWNTKIAKRLQQSIGGLIAAAIEIHKQMITFGGFKVSDRLARQRSHEANVRSNRRNVIETGHEDAVRFAHQGTVASSIELRDQPVARINGGPAISQDA